MQLQEHDTMAEKRAAAREILEDARFEEDQAEAIIATVNLATENLATKGDVEELRGEMKEGFKLLNQRIDFSDERTDNKFGKMDNKIDANANSANARFDQIDVRFDKLESKFKNQTFQIIVGVSSILIAAAALYTALTKLL